MGKIVIADTTCLILLSKINQIDVLNALFSEIYITSRIAAEFNEALPDWIRITDEYDVRQFAILKLVLDAGEASAIALCLEKPDKSLLVIDEMKGRRVAKELGLKITGTLGLLFEARVTGAIPLLRPVFEKIIETNFRISIKVLNELLKKCGEASLPD